MESEKGGDRELKHDYQKLKLVFFSYQNPEKKSIVKVFSSINLLFIRDKKGRKKANFTYPKYANVIAKSLNKRQERSSSHYVDPTRFTNCCCDNN
jgi:hypothetical protein